MGAKLEAPFFISEYKNFHANLQTFSLFFLQIFSLASSCFICAAADALAHIAAATLTMWCGYR